MARACPATPGQLWNQEGTQPPYYAIVAATTFARHRQPTRFRSAIPTGFTACAPINDNQNLVLHGPMDAFPITAPPWLFTLAGGGVYFLAC
jgi:hypothetical protein